MSRRQHWKWISLEREEEDSGSRAALAQKAQPRVLFQLRRRPGDVVQRGDKRAWPSCSEENRCCSRSSRWSVCWVGRYIGFLHPRSDGFEPVSGDQRSPQSGNLSPS